MSPHKSFWKIIVRFTYGAIETETYSDYYDDRLHVRYGLMYGGIQQLTTDTSKFGTEY